MTLADTIFQLLEQQPNQPLCGSCIAQALSLPPKRVYAAMSVIEGRGGRRFHGRCSTCARQRLVAMRSTGAARAT